MNNEAGDWLDETGAPRDLPDPQDREFAEWVATPLRAAERLDVTFDERVMSAVLAEARAGHAPWFRSSIGRAGWWVRPRTLAVSPLAGFAVAAVFAAIVLAGDRYARRLTHGTSVTASRAVAAEPAPDTVHVVRFVFVDPTAEGVYLVGDFNAWARGATRLESAGGGAWSVSLPLGAGRHEYAFIVQGPAGERWVADPYAPRIQDEFDTESSVVILGSATSAETGTS